MDNQSRLNDKQQKLFSDLKEHILRDETLTETEKSFCDDPCIHRYLRARDWNYEQSKDMLYETLRWRREFKPHEITYEEIKGVHDLGGLYHNGLDKQGRPIVYVKPGAYNPFSAEQRVKFLVYVMERAIEKMDQSQGVEKICWIMDFSDYGSRAKSPDGKTVAQNSLHILQNHYPERLGLCFVINSPWYMSWVFKIISIFMHPVTRSKINWIYGSKEELVKQLEPHISLDQLEEKYGGTNTPANATNIVSSHNDNK